MNDDWPCTVNFNIFFGAANPENVVKEIPLAGNPDKGQGDRCLFCDQYEKCLDFAVISNWDGFNCENCVYEKQGPVVFCYGDLLALLDEPWDDDFDDDDFDDDWDCDFDPDLEEPEKWDQ